MVKPATIRFVGVMTNSHGTRSISAIYPPAVSADNVAAEVLGLTDLSFETPLVAFVGSVEEKKVTVSSADSIVLPADALFCVSYQKLVDTVVSDSKGFVLLPLGVTSLP
jgi:hypothetical protein